jgi:NTP pyrophosphatase (non-canonical NTP hydrolase)
MTFDEYQKKAIVTNLAREDKFQELMQQALGLADEAGEVLAVFKKWIRDQDADFAQLDTENLAKELGDILWYIAVVAHDLDISLDHIASKNIEKLRSRMDRGVLRGGGDNR